VLYREWGADVIGMTAMPEARLAREAELPYALLGMVTDYDAWRGAEAGVEASEILAVVAANADSARRTLAELAKALPAMREPSPIDTALDAALVTPRSAWRAHEVARLDAVMGRLVREGFARRFLGSTA
jgi:5'-methylthioadenosine phosphorylase